MSGRQPRHHEDVVAVVIAAIRTLRRRRIEHCRTQLRPHREPVLNRSRLYEQPVDVARQEIAIGSVDETPAHVLLDSPLRAQSRLKAIPQIVILAHRVIQPAHVPGVSYGVTGIAKADDLIDPLATARANIGEPGRIIRRRLPSEAILRRHDDFGLVAGVAQGLHERPRDHHVPALDHRRTRRDHGDTAHCGISIGSTRTPR